MFISVPAFVHVSDGQSNRSNRGQPNLSASRSRPHGTRPGLEQGGTVRPGEPVAGLLECRRLCEERSPWPHRSETESHSGQTANSCTASRGWQLKPMGPLRGWEDRSCPRLGRGALDCLARATTWALAKSIRARRRLEVKKWPLSTVIFQSNPSARAGEGCHRSGGLSGHSRDAP